MTVHSTGCKGKHISRQKLVAPSSFRKGTPILARKELGAHLASQFSPMRITMASFITNLSGDKNNTPFGSPGGVVVNEALHLRNRLNIATWNVRGLLQVGKLEILENEMLRSKIKILGIAETHNKNSGHFTTTKGNLMVCAGNETKNNNGVGFMIHKDIVNSIIHYDTHSDRIISIKIHASPVNLNILQIYAPTTEASDEMLDDFYNELQDILDSTPSREMTIIMGDFNAKVGKQNTDEQTRNILGKYGLGERNSRGDNLIQFCMGNSLAITNTLFEHHPRRLFTWTHPDGTHKNQIDYILVNARWRSSIKNVTTRPGMDCGSDHQALVAVLRAKIKKCHKHGCTRKLQITDEEILQSAFNKEISKDQICTANPNTIWLKIEAAINKAVKTENRINTTIRVPRQPWMSLDTLDLVEARRKIKNKGLNDTQRRKIFSRMNKDIQRSCRNDKNNYYNHMCQSIQRNAELKNSKELFLAIKNITKQVKMQNWCPLNDKGIKLNNLSEILDEWKRYCGNLFNDEYTHAWDNQSSVYESEPHILREEVVNAIKKLKDGKANAADQINAEIIKALGTSGVDLLYILCQTIWDSKKWPKDWCKSVFIPLHKKGAKNKCDNYRLIALIPHVSKILLYIINDRLKSFLDHQIAREQTGFMKGKGTREHMLNLRLLIEKAREFNRSLYICFIDYQKAFDSVRWSDLWNTLQEMGVPCHLIALISDLYNNATGIIQIDDQQSKVFKPKKGVRQGCILSPQLFNIYSEQVMRKALEQDVEGFRVNGETISNLRYADDTAILASSEEGLKRQLTRLQKYSEDSGLKLNQTKTKIMIVDRENNNRPEKKEINGFEVVDQYIYLGTLINNTGDCSQEILRRIQLSKNAMNKLQRLWKSKQLTRGTGVQIVKTLVFPILLYGAEAWTVKERERRKIDAFEMWCWRRMLRIPWTAKRTNASILEELKVRTRLSTTILQQILKYYGHISRRPTNSLERLVVEGQIEGRRPRGRSPKRWLDQIKTTVGEPISQIYRNTQCRTTWRAIVAKISEK